ncbi:ArsR/SmtB family transcription factor [Rubrobacter aplysinae]|uniref:ArsR/SmtB family transcription factor n=1 Tax=Rubrobacter aplysinae TaxID=909625 RepID=UPI00064BD552|nr:metalloregulator ArsR/SmtB family transcription factor [Rubrobacter aplysinae]
MVAKKVEERGGIERVANEGVCEVDLVHPAAVRRVRESLPEERATRRAAEVFGVLADPTRARIVYALSVEELCVCDVAAVAGLSVSAASHQLKRLRDSGVVDYHKEGRLAFYSLVDDHVRGLMEDGVARVLAAGAGVGVPAGANEAQGA